MKTARLMPLTLLVLLTLPLMGHAQDKGESESENVLTLRVDGALSIDPQGKVLDYRITTKLDPAVEAMVRRAVPRWRFKPILVDGKPAIAQSPMRITLAAVEVEQGYQVKVDNVVFWPNTQEEYEAQQASQKAHPRMSVEGEAPAPLVWITSKSMRPPKYPPDLQRSGVEGIVLLNVRLNPDGTVAEVFAAQSSLLNVKGSSGLLDRARATLERNASAAAGRWKFEVDAEDAASLKPSSLTVRVPVEYMLGTQAAGPEPLVGKWRHEFRGPNVTAPWLADDNTHEIGVSDLNSNEILAGGTPFALSDKGVIGTAL